MNYSCQNLVDEAIARYNLAKIKAYEAFVDELKEIEKLQKELQ